MSTLLLLIDSYFLLPTKESSKFAYWQEKLLSYTSHSFFYLSFPVTFLRSETEKLMIPQGEETFFFIPEFFDRSIQIKTTKHLPKTNYVGYNAMELFLCVNKSLILFQEKRKFRASTPS
jgi:hypothetical protein